MKDNFHKQFQQALNEKCDVLPHNTILVALSGGADSVALLHLVKESNIQCFAAHCNFHLRGAESDADEKFVRSLCEDLNIPLRTISFKTTEYAEKQKISIEMAARELRYNWFEELAKELEMDFVATGHHGDDAIETFFLNLTRGTGIKGLTGISWRRGNIIRPLLFASAQQIKDYCQENSFQFRTDSTNHETVFYRNKIRSQIIPLFNEMNPSFFSTMQSNMEYLKESREIIEDELIKIQLQITAREEDSFLIPISVIKEYAHRKSLILDLLQPYGFSGQQIHQIVKTVDTLPGKQFLSRTYRLVVDRFNLILTPITEHDRNRYAVQKGVTEINHPLHLTLKKYPRTSNFQFSKDPNLIHLDADLLEFPLYVRHPSEGDKFQPLGMSNFKKLSDFFIDEKFSIIDKEETWLLINGDEIVWVIGHRIDNRFKITHRTKSILEIKLL